MKKPAFFTESKKSDLPILIVDKKGTLGSQLCEKLEKENLVVFLSEKNIKEQNLIHVPFFKKIPQVPDNTYSHQIIIDEHLEISESLLEAFIKKAKKDNCPITLVLSKNFASDSLIEKHLHAFEKIKVVIAGDIFAKDFLYDSSTLINKFIKSVKTFGKINIEGDGTEEYEPVYLDDAVLGILEAALSENEKDRVFFLFPKYKPTVLSVAHTFQKIEPDIKIDFVKSLKKEREEKPLTISGRYILDENYNLYNTIKRIDLKIKKTEKSESEVKEKKDKEVKVANLFWGAVLTVIFFLSLPILFTFLFLKGGEYFLNMFKNDIKNENLVSAKSSSFYSKNLFAISKFSFVAFSKEAEVFDQEKRLASVFQKIEDGLELSNISYSLLQSLERGDFLKTEDNLKTALSVYQKQKQLGNIPSSISDDLSEAVDFTSATIDFWPEILGYNSKKTYLVLFQNNMELRPGGGVITLYGLITLEKGKIASFSLHETSEADNSLKARVEPPYALRRYLPSVNLSFKDISFNPDFSKNAVSAVTFLNSMTPQKIDGVIGADLYLIKILLETTGPVNIAQFNETVNAQNFFEMAQRQNKGDFLKEVINALSLKLSSEKDIKYLTLLKNLTALISQKHIYFAFNDKSLQSAFAVNGWGAVLYDERKSSDIAVNDYLGIFEANLSENNVNDKVFRKVSQIATIDEEGNAKETLKIDYKNEDKNNRYKNYIKIVLPQDAKLERVEIDGEAQDVTDATVDPSVYEKKGFIPPKGLEIERVNEGGKTIYGFLLSVEKGKTKSIAINYTLPAKLNLNKPNFTYSLRIIKQPGVESLHYEFSLKLPKSLTAINLAREITINDNTLSTSLDIIKDKEVFMSLTKK